MKLYTILLVFAVLMTSCNFSKNKDRESDRSRETEKETTTEIQPLSGNDAELTRWLSGKKLVSTSKQPEFDMWNNLLLYADGACMDKDQAKAKWYIKDSKFIFQSVMNLTKDIQKVDDTTLVFKGMISDQKYILKPVE